MGAVPFLLAGTLVRRRTRFGVIEVREEDGVRVLLEDGAAMSAMDPDDPGRLLYAYQRMLAAVAGPPGTALVIGVAGGSLCRWLVARGFAVTGVELNRATARLARKHFGLDGVTLRIAEGRRYLERHDGPYDLVVLDASTEDYIPPALASVECFRRVRDVLAPGGRALMNSWAGAPRADDELASWRTAFDRGWVVSDPSQERTDNRVLVSVPVEADGYRIEPMPAVGDVRHDP